MKPITLLDPEVFISAFENDLNATIFLLHAILDECKKVSNPLLKITDIKQRNTGFIRSDGLQDQSLVLYAEDSDGNLYDFDMMVADKEYFAKQARVHGDFLTVYDRFAENQDVEDYILLFTLNTLHGFDLPLSVIELRIAETGEIVDGKDHTLIINCEHDTATYSDFHDVIHDLRQSDPNEMHTSVLKHTLMNAISNQTEAL